MSVRLRANDENARPLRHVNAQIDSSRFGFAKPKKEAPEKRHDAASTIPETVEEPVDLLAIYDSTMGDLKLLHTAMKLKRHAGTYEFKEKIEELKSFLNPHRDALKDVEQRQTSLRENIETAQADINRRFGSFGARMAEIGQIHKQELENEREKHSKELASVKDKHTKEVCAMKLKAGEIERSHRLQVESKDEEFAERERKTHLVHSERIAQLQRQVEATTAAGEQQLANANIDFSKRVAEHDATVKEMEATARRREEELLADAASELLATKELARRREESLQQQMQIAQQEAKQQEEQLRQQCKEREDSLIQQMQKQSLASEQKLEDLCRHHKEAAVSSQGLADELRSQLSQQTSKREQLEEDVKGMRSKIADLTDQNTGAQEEIKRMEKAHEDETAELEKKMTDFAANVKDITRRKEETYLQKIKEMESAAKQEKEKILADGVRKLEDVRTSAHQREDELKQQMSQQSAASQQQISALQKDVEALSSESSQLSKDLKAMSNKCGDQEKQLRFQIEEVSARRQALEKDLAQEKEARNQEAVAFASLQAEHSSALKHGEEQKETLHELQSAQAACQEANSELRRDLALHEKDAERLREALAEEQATLKKRGEKLESANTQLAQTREELAGVRAEALASKDACNRITLEKRELEIEFNSFREHNSTTNQVQIQDIADLKVMVEALNQKVDCGKAEIAAREGDVATTRLSMRALEDQLAAAELSRRELHNTIQELKGNIRVMCRVRPGDSNKESALAQAADNKLSLSHGTEVYPYSFDKVFGTGSTQDELFAEVSGLVQSALDGYKVCIFAYGQTGSGKTYTMQGRESEESWGIIPRSLRQIFNSAEQMRAKGWHWTLKASFIEVYNEVLKDLLRDETSATATPQCHMIKHDADWGMVVTNVVEKEVNSMGQIQSLMNKAARLRAVGSTDMNAQSSRSHSIFALYLTGVNRELNSELHGALHLVDLAGSERLDKSGAVGDRLRETQNINKSLSSLADVFTAKAENRSHVPFRNSKLTHLMEPCLSGQGKTLMFVNVGPEADNSHETWCSLRFAGQVSQCTTGGKPRRAAKTPASSSSSSAGPCTKKRS